MTDCPRRNPNILTQATLARIPAMVANGLNRHAIAEQLGCKVNTLQVRCSQNGIRLRNKRPRDYTLIRLSRTTADALREHAEKRGETEQALVRRLIETIARDDLYAAVLDDGQKAA